jgi:hypothetical protein
MTAQDLITEALTLIGRLGAGRTPGVTESNYSLGILNAMLDSWSTKRLTVYSIASATYTLTAGTESYTIGTGGVWNTARPIAIESADIAVTFTGSSKTSYFPLRIIGQKEFASIQTLGDQSDISRSMYCDCAFPLSTVYLYPIPGIAAQIDLYTWQPLGQLISLMTTASFPNGYARAIAYNLAVELAGVFEKAIPESVATIAQASKEAIEGLNARLTPGDEVQAQGAVETQPGNKQ